MCPLPSKGTLHQENGKSLAMRVDALGIAEIAKHCDPVSPRVSIE
jgi:hypothetical protein